MRTVVVRLGAVLATAIVAVAALGTPAWAHNELIGSDPAEGSTVTSAITTVTLTFAQPIPAQDTTVAVIGPDGVSYSTGVLRAEGSKAHQDVRPLPPGAITVQWRTISLDGDPVRGEFGFTNAYVAPTPTQPPPTTPPATEPNATVVAASPVAAGGETAGGTGWLVAIAVLVVVAAAGAGFVLWRRRT
jgi:methionine-rich copper-binding protein CopC